MGLPARRPTQARARRGEGAGLAPSEAKRGEGEGEMRSREGDGGRRREGGREGSRWGVRRAPGRGRGRGAVRWGGVGWLFAFRSPRLPFRPPLRSRLFCSPRCLLFISLSLSRIFAAKSERLKQAKAEADVEIGAYKKEREAEYQRRIADGSDSNVATVGKLEAESQASVDAISKATTDKKEDVLSFLVDCVTTVAF